MKLNIHSGKRVLYKHNKQWCVGKLAATPYPTLNEKGLFLFIIPQEYMELPEEEVPYVHDAEINDIFLDGIQLTEYDKSNSDMFMTKEQYEELIEDEDFIAAVETAYVSDGEYYYYPISKFNRVWLEKQPFDYVMRMY